MYDYLEPNITIFLGRRHASAFFGHFVLEMDKIGANC